MTPQAFGPAGHPGRGGQHASLSETQIRTVTVTSVPGPVTVTMTTRIAVTSQFPAPGREDVLQFTPCGPPTLSLSLVGFKTDDDTERQLVHTLAHAIVFMVSIICL